MSPELTPILTLTVSGKKHGYQCKTRVQTHSAFLLSGEALQGSEGFGIDASILDRMAQEIKELVELGAAGNKDNMERSRID